MKYTQSQWDREIGWGKVPEEYKLKEKPMHPYFRKQLGLENEEMTKETKLEEYKRKINYDVWEDVSHVQGITFNRQPYNIKEINVNYSMKANEYVQSHNNSSAGTNDRDNKS